MFYYFCRHFSTLLDRIAFYIITILGIIKIIITNFFQLFFERKYFILCMRALIFPLMYTLFTSLFCFELLSYETLVLLIKDIVNQSPNLIPIIIGAFILFSQFFSFVYAFDHLTILIGYGYEGYKLYKDIQDILSDYFVRYSHCYLWLHYCLTTRFLTMLHCFFQPLSSISHLCLSISIASIINFMSM